MQKHALTFLAAFFVAALITLAVRSVRYDPYEQTPSVSDSTPHEKSMVHNQSPTPSQSTHLNHNTPAPDIQHAEHSTNENFTASKQNTSDEKKVINTHCPICGMEVDPSLPPVEYQGKLIGLGCRACPPKFADDPKRWGEAALQANGH